MRLERIRSMTLHRQEVREIGRYEEGSSAGLSGFRRGMIIDCFHWGGTKEFFRRRLNRWWRWVLFSGVRFFNIMLLMRSVPTALLLDLGRHRSISAGVMGSLRIVWEADRILDIMACWNCGLGGMLGGNTLLK